MQRQARLTKEIKMLTESPPYGISCWLKDDSLSNLEAQIVGGTETPYTNGIFKLEIQVPERYPFEPPKVRFITPIYHPNIDTGGRICLDLLKMPPKGAWKPILNISTVLSSIQLLMAEPNPDDPLMADISSEFKHNRALYERKAKEWTEKYAVQEILQDISDTENAGNSAEKITEEKDIVKNEEQKCSGNETRHLKATSSKRTFSKENVAEKRMKLS